MEMLINRATGERRTPIARPPRKGKTAEDKNSGAWASRFANRDARVAWQQDPRATSATFPAGRSK